MNFPDDYVNQVILGDCLEVMKGIPDNSIAAIVTDPPYALTSGGSKGFMGQAWDGALPSIEIWQEALRICKPGAHLMAFGGTRTYHRLVCTIEDAGWIVREMLCWIYGMGFPKSTNISKNIDAQLGAEREVVGYTRQGPRSMFDGGKPRPATLPATLWDGYGSALKPAVEPICLAMKPIDTTDWIIELTPEFLDSLEGLEQNYE